MPWFKVDDGFANSRQVLAIPRRYRAQAVGLWCLAGSWSAKELTDGFVPMFVVKEVCASSPAIAQHLVEVGLWTVCSDPVGFLFASWAKYQPTADQVRTRRADEAEKKRIARESKRKLPDQQRSENVPRGHIRESPRESPGESPGESVLPDPTRPDPTLTTGNSPMEVVTSVGASNAAPARRGTRIPDGYEPREAVWDAIAAEIGVTRRQLDDEHKQFTDYYRGAAGQRGVKLDWDATWRNWMRTAAKRGDFASAGRRVPIKLAPSEERDLRLQALKDNNPTQQELLA